ncbi:MAG: hypothetical protein ACRYG8_06800 [Janthinobacterium lividum]
MNDATTQPELTVQRLSREQIRTVYPLMQAVEPGLSLTHWIRYARRVAGPSQGRKGILVVQRAGLLHPCGAVCYRRDRNLAGSILLTAEHFIALDLLHPEAVLRALLSALDELGQALGCDSIRSIVHGGRTELLDDFHVAGHAWEGVTLSKTLAGRPSV